jgi:hypothetical protein
VIQQRFFVPLWVFIFGMERSSTWEAITGRVEAESILDSDPR